MSVVVRRALLWLAGAGWLCACSADTGELRRVTLSVEVAGVARDATQAFERTTPLGWDVTLVAAELSVAAVYFRNAAPSSGTADEQGRVTAQVLGPLTIDALDPEPQGIWAGTAITERARSAELWLIEAERGPIADALGPGRALVHVAGTARRDDVEIVFDGGLFLPLQSDARVYESFQNRIIRRLDADFVPAAGATLQLRVDPSQFLDAVPFEMLGPESSTREFETDAEQLQLRNGVARSSGYGFSLRQ